MNIRLLVVGKTDVAWVREALEIYTSRLVHYVPFSVSEIPQLKGVSALTRAQIKDKEAELILARLKPADELLLFDEHGKEFTSVAFATFLQERMLHVRGDLVFAIGGAYGFAESVHARAAGEISLSRMTFSHQMVRAIAAEQLYRAMTIIKGEPYHNE